MMQTRRITNEHWLWFLIGLLALALRLINLGELPLSNFEAGWAVQSWQAARGELLAVGPNPGYIFPTAVLFFIFDSSNFLARLWPALAGCLAVLSLYGFRQLFSREVALIAALGLALDPGMVALSRLAGGPMMALGFGLAALVLAANRRYVEMGAFGALALISGAPVGMGLTGLAIAWVAGRWVGITAADPNAPAADPYQNPVRGSRDSLRLGLMLGAGTAVLVSTLFFRYVSGLGAWAGGFIEFFNGWGSPSGIPSLRLPAAVGFYQPLALIFGLIAAARGWATRHKVSRWLSIWFLTALVLPMLYPGRQVYDVIWALLPLWGLAALELRRHLRLLQPWFVGVVQAGVIFILIVLLWLVSHYLAPGTPTWLALAVVPMLIILATVLVGMSWSWEISWTGLTWGVSAALGLLVLSAAVGASQLRANRASELWSPHPTTLQADLLLDSLKELGILEHGQENSLEIFSLVEDASLRWVLRNFEDVQFIPSLGQDAFPTVLITMENYPNLPQLSSYRGQDFVWYEIPGWDGVLPPDWFGWLTYRQAPVWPQWIVLWARADLFPEDTPVEQTVELPVEEGAGFE